jgi:hypothetical protein
MDLRAVRVAAEVRVMAALRIVRTTVKETDGRVLWHVGVTAGRRSRRVRERLDGEHVPRADRAAAGGAVDA